MWPWLQTAGTDARRGRVQLLKMRTHSCWTGSKSLEEAMGRRSRGASGAWPLAVSGIGSDLGRLGGPCGDEVIHLRVHAGWSRGDGRCRRRTRAGDGGGCALNVVGGDVPSGVIDKRSERVGRGVGVHHGRGGLGWRGG